MLELHPAEVTLVRVCARPAVLDAFPALDAFPCRVAPDELLLLGAGAGRAELVEAASAHLAGADAGGLAVDQTDGWAAWTLSGAEAEEAFARLSAISLPPDRPAFVQGAVAGVAGKAALLSDRIHLLVASTLGHHLRERVLAACADLEPSESESER